MRFTKFFAGVTFALSASQAQATVSPGEVAETFERLTNIASDIIQTVASLDSTKIITSVPRIAGEFGQLVEGVVDAVDIIGNPDQFKDIGKSDQDKICDALENFVDKARDAVDSIIGKDSIIGRTPLVSIIANVLSVAADALEQLARSAVKIVPGCKERIEKKLDLLNNSLDQGITNFRSKAIEQGDSPISIPTGLPTGLPTGIPTGIPTAVPTAALSSLVDLIATLTPVASSLPQVTGGPVPVPFQA